MSKADDLLNKNASLGRAARLLRGVAVCLVVSLVCIMAAKFTHMPVMMLALILGLLAARLYKVASLKAGIDFTAKPLLLIGVALLGLKIDIGAILAAGAFAPLLSVGALLLTFLFGLVLCRVLGINRQFSVMISAAVAICGVSAAMALCCVLPGCKNRERELAVTIAGITVLSAAVMIIYPAIAHSLDLTDFQSGAFFGATIHNVSQVVGAGYSVSVEAGDVGTFVKLIRVSMLLPVIVLVSLVYGGAENTDKPRWTTYIPPFLIAFFILAVIRSFGVIPENIISPLSSLSELLLIMSLVAIGLKTNILDIATVGPKPLMAMVGTTVFMVGIVLWALMVF